MPLRAIIIDVKERSVPNGVESRWEDITKHMPILTRDIKTPALDSDSDLSAVVTGMPTIFARANLFKLALEYVCSPDLVKNGSEGLLNYYRNLVDEWRGFIAAIALDYTRIEVRRIKLAYSDGKKMIDTANIYEPKGAFGNALFERKPLWSLQGMAGVEDNEPFIDVIFYGADRNGRRNVVGAVSPESLLFTAPGYDIQEDNPYIDKQTRKFTDPLKAHMTEDQAISLYAYVGHIENKLNKLAEYYSGLSEDIRPQYATAQTQLRTWKEEIKEYCDKNGYNIQGASIPPVDKFQEPNNIIFNFSSKFFGLDGLIYDEGDAPENAIQFDPKNLLLKKDESEIARIIFNNAEISKNPALLRNQPIYVLKAEIKGRPKEYAYFALPFTPLGLNVFGKNIGALTGIDDNSAIRSKITAIFDETAPIDNLEVGLEIHTQNGQIMTYRESYTVNKAGSVNGKDIMIWPNFIARDWNRYFLFSEMPHNATSSKCPFKATPIVGRIVDNDFRIIVDEESDVPAPVLLAQNGQITITDRVRRDTGLQAKLLVVSDNRINDNDYKYEIYESNLPFKGVKLSSGVKESGYLVIRYESGVSDQVPQNLVGQEHPALKETSLGIDFGSTNTSVAYSVDKELKGITFKNHRVSLLQAGKSRGCQERDLFFFQSKPLEGNAIKSILAVHDRRRLPTDNKDSEAREISGGMPCFDPSLLPVQSVSENSIMLRCFDIGEVRLVHNMKWSDREEDINNKKAFLRSLMLHIYAELYTMGCVPTSLKWSYPSAMSESLIRQYSNIWEDLRNDLTPIIDQNRNPIGLNICRSNVSGPLNLDANGWGQQQQQGGWGQQQQQQQGGWGQQQQQQQGGWGQQQPQQSGWGQQQQPQQSGWGQQQQPQQGGWGPQQAPQQPVEDLEPDNNMVAFNFRDVDPKKCMTEACAVANSMMSSNRNVNMTDNSLMLIFDVGGSTTDISAMILYRKPGTAQFNRTLIKQNSIKFAAQRVVKAAKYEPNLKSVLDEVCKTSNLKIPGLNLGDNRFNAETASFYLEQVLDQLDAKQLRDFYRLVSSRCSKLMSVDLYVTGLILYYAGQLANKLIKVIRTSLAQEDPRYQYFTPNVNVMFAGKGARIFEWYSTVEPASASDYYQTMFIRGMGGMQEAQMLLAGPPHIDMSEQVSTEVKYEVSKGLALDSAQGIKVPGDEMEAIEILGEDNFVVRRLSDGSETPLNFDNAITAKMMSFIGGDFQQKLPMGMQFACNRFADFAFVFYQTAQRFGLQLTQDDFMNGFRGMNINNYIMNLPEYLKAYDQVRVGQKFDFVAPIIILEGMKFYEEYLTKSLS